ncbi:GNAT family N-acetyltransferase [Aquimarina sp. Aq107]|uniref:GNAT family N-acetyltransferase n=1 Tax=Aquimarina sp. Aq107 TaxID=1191912 RepID=UPI001F3D21DE|nr:GNAT family N-acetyltransferase [Aquimarina sp. Aq107]
MNNKNETNIRIELLTRENEFLEKGVNYFWKCWGNDSNFNFYNDCIKNSLSDGVSLPKFYILLNGKGIIGSYALLTNDIISRQDLLPWFACLFIDEQFRNKGYAEKLLVHGLKEANNKGFEKIYLSTDLKNFYEKKRWDLFSHGYNLSGENFKIYVKSTK